MWSLLIKITLSDVEFFRNVRDIVRGVTQRLRIFGGVRLQAFQAILDVVIDEIRYFVIEESFDSLLNLAPDVFLLGLRPDLLDDQGEQLANFRNLVKRPDDSRFDLVFGAHDCFPSENIYDYSVLGR